MTWWLWLVCILVLLLTAGLSFVIGVRYCAQRMLPRILATKTPKEIRELSIAAANQIPDDG